MTERSRRLGRIMELREEKTRRVLARLAREAEKQRVGVRALEQLISAVQEQMDSTLGQRYSNGARKAAALNELDAHAQTLNVSLEQLGRLRQQSQRALDQLAEQQRSAARDWRRSDVRLGYVASIARDERIARMLRLCELEDEAHAERHSRAWSWQ